MTEPCPACSHPVAASARFCAACGAAVDASATPTGTVCIFVGEMLFDIPINGDFSSWKATPTLMAFAVVIALAIHGFRTATAGRSLLGERSF